MLKYLLLGSPPIIIASTVYLIYFLIKTKITGQQMRMLMRKKLKKEQLTGVCLYL